MTNREWVESLSTVKFAKHLCDVAYEKWCAFGGNWGDCVLGVAKWLQQEHKEPKKEFTAAQLYGVFKKGFQDRRAISLEEAEKIIKGVFEDE